MVHGKNRIPYWIDRRLTGLAGPNDDATISFGLPFEPEDSQYGESRLSRHRLVRKPGGVENGAWLQVQNEPQGKGFVFVKSGGPTWTVGGTIFEMWFGAL